MRKYLFIIILFIFLFNFSFGSTEPIVLTKGNQTEFWAEDRIIIFEVSSFSNNEEIKFEIKATNFIDNKITYKFLDTISTNENEEEDNPFDLEPFKTKTEDGYTYNYYSIQKNETYLSNLNGKYLSIIFNLEGLVYIKLTDEQKDQTNINNSKNITTDSNYLKKYGTITVDSADGGFIMDTSGFQKGEEIYLKITAAEFIEREIYYEFVDDIDNYNPSIYFEDYYSASPSRTDYDGYKKIQYYTIKKDSSHLNGLQGNYLFIYFECYGKITVTNTEKDEGKISTGVIIVIIIIIIVIVAGCIGYFCYRRKKQAQIRSRNPLEPVINYNNNQLNNNNQQINNNQNYNNQQYNINQNYNNNQQYNNNQNYNNNQQYNNNNQQYNNNQNYNNNQQYNNNNQQYTNNQNYNNNLQYSNYQNDNNNQSLNINQIYINNQKKSENEKKQDNQNYNNNQKYNNYQNYNNNSNNQYYNNNQQINDNQNINSNQNYNINQNDNNNQNNNQNNDNNQNLNNNQNDNQNYNHNIGNNYDQNYNLNSKDQINAESYNNDQQQNDAAPAPDIGYSSK